jgi:hypothetical protein
MKERLSMDLEAMDLGLELLELKSPGRLPGRPHDLPLVVKTRGPPDVSDFALSFIMQAVEDANEEITSDLKSTGGTAFRDVKVSFETYNLADVESYDMTEIQSAGALNPSKSPTVAPTAKPEQKSDVAVLYEEENTGLPWWAWLIIVLVILLCCCCICCCCYRRHKRDEAGDKIVGNQDLHQVNLFVQDRMRPIRRRFKKKPEPKKRPLKKKPSQRSLAVSRRTRRSERPPRSVHTRPRSGQRSA